MIMLSCAEGNFGTWRHQSNLPPSPSSGQQISLSVHFQQVGKVTLLRLLPRMRNFPIRHCMHNMVFRMWFFFTTQDLNWFFLLATKHSKERTMK